jgi:CheY-like chemotaxis protein
MAVRPSTPTASSPARIELLAGSRGRILVAEDNEINQLVAHGLVSALGFEVTIVDDGAQALDALAAGGFAAVLMDCHMPVMDGFEATRRIRDGAVGGVRVPVIAMTAGALNEDRQRCLDAGMDDHISKPVTLEALESILVRWAVERV